jgi:hypothetical protein
VRLLAWLLTVLRLMLHAVDCCAHVDVAAVQADVLQDQPAVAVALTAAKQLDIAQDAMPACVSSSQRRDFEVTFLGTGAAVPSKYRNVTGIHLNLFDNGGLLMDCGRWHCYAAILIHPCTPISLPL